jgi:2-methylcitrate dehydratase PrpD
LDQAYAGIHKTVMIEGVFMEGKSISEGLASFLMGLVYEDLPLAVVEKAKLCILDLFGAHFAGQNMKLCRPIKDYISKIKAEPKATVWCLGIKTLGLEAAFSNGAMCHCALFDDMHARTISHLGSVVIPAAICVAEEQQCSGKELILAIACGYEAIGRVGAAMLTPKFLQSGFRTSGTFGVFGSAAAAARLLALNPEETTAAFGLAANFGAGLTAFAAEGTDDFVYQNGLASRNGVLASLLAKNGAIAPRYIFEIGGGYSQAFGGNSDTPVHVLSGLGHKFEIEEVRFKSVPACGFVQSTAQAALEISRSKDFKTEDIKKIELGTFPLGKHYPGVDNRGPFTKLTQAQMSNQFTIASVLVRKDLLFDNYVNFEDPLVRDLAYKVTIMEDEEAKVKWPEEQLAKIAVYLNDGSILKAVSRQPGFLDDAGVVDKCRLYLGRVLNEHACGQFIRSVQSLETLDNVNRLMQLLNKELH